MGGSKCSEKPIFVIFIKENWICAMIRHHAESSDILLARNITFDSDVRQWSHSLMITLHCLWDESNNRTRGQFECGVIWFCFCFDFVCSPARYHLERGIRLKLDGRRWTGGGGLENWAIFVDAICVLFPNCYCLKSFV